MFWISSDWTDIEIKIDRVRYLNLNLGETIDNVADTFKQRLLQEEDKEKQVS